jgi:hypothetical protein
MAKKVNQVHISPQVSPLEAPFSISVDYDVEAIMVDKAIWCFGMIFDFTHDNIQVQLGSCTIDGSKGSFSFPVRNTYST